MSEYSDRLDRIKAGRNKTLEYNKKHGLTTLPQMHDDLYWLLEIIEMYMDETDFELLMDK